MYEELDKTIEILKDTSAGWVNRRDAALALGEYARRALDALHAHAGEKDVDVRRGVNDALAPFSTTMVAGGVPAPPPAPKKPKPPSLKTLAEACIRKNRRAVKQDGDGYLVRVRTREDRSQDVRIDLYRQADTREMVRVSTECGPADEETIGWAIRSNNKFIYSTFCVEEHDGEERLLIVSNFDPELVTPDMVKNAVKEVAYYGDWLEKKLTGRDEF